MPNKIKTRANEDALNTGSEVLAGNELLNGRCEQRHEANWMDQVMVYAMGLLLV